MHPFEALEVNHGRVGIHWFGQSSFAFKDSEGIVTQVDPYFPEDRPPERFIYPESPLDETTLRTDFVLLTHDHGDHTCMESLLRIHEAFPEAKYVGPAESIMRMGDQGIPDRLLTEVIAGESAPLATMTATAVWAKPPQGAPEDGIKAPDVQHLGYVLEAGRLRIYISGDPINTFADHEELIQPIAALTPHIGLLTTHPDEGEFPFFGGSVEMALKLGLEAVVPAHYSCFVTRDYDPREWAGSFPEVGPEPIVIPYNESIVFPD
jgi:L-ascorbate metabolism protein UlaG (beta-lactamase superfamily)